MMKNKVIKGIKHMVFFVLIFMVCVVTFKIAAITFEGYHMYKVATEETSIEDKIKEIKADKNYVTIDHISEEFLQTLVKSEDHRFMKHKGIDVIAITRAMYYNLKAGRVVQGGSTITQQLAKNMFFSFEKRFERKVAEVFVTKHLEKILSKEEILELYCNKIYFGENCYGIKAATRHYYNSEPIKMNEVQIKALVKTIKSPKYYNPNAIQQVA